MFLFKKSTFLKLSSERFALRWLTTSPAFEKHLSAGMLVEGQHKYFIASFLSSDVFGTISHDLEHFLQNVPFLHHLN